MNFIKHCLGIPLASFTGLRMGILYFNFQNFVTLY